MADGGFIEGQRMAVFDECFGTGGLSGVDGNRLFIRLGEVVDRFEALVGNVDGIISRIEFDADAGIPASVFVLRRRRNSAENPGMCDYPGERRGFP